MTTTVKRAGQLALNFQVVDFEGLDFVLDNLGAFRRDGLG